MATEWIDIIDTAVKIGLGALISGIATYSVANLNHKKDLNKSLSNKKIEILEEISELAEEYFYFFSSLYNLTGGMLLLKVDNVGGKLTKSQKEHISTKHKSFNDILSLDSTPKCNPD